MCQCATDGGFTIQEMVSLSGSSMAETNRSSFDRYPRATEPRKPLKKARPRRVGPASLRTCLELVSACQRKGRTLTRVLSESVGGTLTVLFECEVPPPLSHFDSGTYVAIPGPYPVPVSQWFRYLCRTKSTPKTHLLTFTWAQPSQGGSSNAGGAFDG